MIWKCQKITCMRSLTFTIYPLSPIISPIKTTIVEQNEYIMCKYHLSSPYTFNIYQFYKNITFLIKKLTIKLIDIWLPFNDHSSYFKKFSLNTPPSSDSFFLSPFFPYLVSISPFLSSANRVFFQFSISFKSSVC